MLRPDIYELVKEAVSDGLVLVKDAIDNNKYIGSYWEFPELEFFDSGFPRFSHLTLSSDKAPKDLSSIFKEGRGNAHEARCDPKLIASWVRFRDSALQDESLSNYWKFSEGSELSMNLSVFGFLGDILEIYFFTYKTCDFTEENFRAVYETWEPTAFAKTLPIDIVVPLICVPFSFERLEISTDTIIERMSDEFQLARCPTERTGFSPQNTLLGASTHALVIKGWYIDQLSEYDKYRILSDIAAYAKPLAKVDQFMAALRVLTGVETGYGQVIARPSGWCPSWKAWLPNVFEARTRAYPDRLENHGWLEKREILTESLCKNIDKIYNGVQQISELHVPCRRLNAAFLRRDEEDSILDITIAT